MYKNPAVLPVALLLLLGMPSVSRAQPGSTVVKHGMFGPRVLGVPLQPKATAFSNNFKYGPSGNFEGLRSNWVLPAVPTDVIVPATGDFPDIYQAMLARPPLPVTVVQPQSTSRFAPPPASQPATMPGLEVPVPQQVLPPPAAAAPGPATAPELPLRRGPGVTATSAAATPAEAPALPQPVGPLVLSPLQTPGAAYTTFRTDFSYPKPASNQVQTQLTSRLSNARWLQAISPIQVSVDGQTAVLRGTVATSYDRVLAEEMVRMEAGIWKVDNQLKVNAP